MTETIFTFPGRAGDAIFQFPIAYWWAKQHGKKFTAWLDQGTCKMLVPLFEDQPCVEKVELKPGIEGYGCGGQPFHFGLETSDYTDKQVWHLGLRNFPARQLTLECQATSHVPINVSPSLLADTNPFQVEPLEPANRLVLHGQGVYAHTRTVPAFWKFLASIRHELPSLFDEIVFVGSERDRGVAKLAYPDWQQCDDEGNFLTLARYLVGSKAVIGVGSSVVALSSVLCLPTIRVHDPIGNASKSIWSGLGANQLNDTELELRTSFQTWRSTWLEPVPSVEDPGTPISVAQTSDSLPAPATSA